MMFTRDTCYFNACVCVCVTQKIYYLNTYALLQRIRVFTIHCHHANQSVHHPLPCQSERSPSIAIMPIRVFTIHCHHANQSVHHPLPSCESECSPSIAIMRIRVFTIHCHHANQSVHHPLPSCQSHMEHKELKKHEIIFFSATYLFSCMKHSSVYKFCNEVYKLREGRLKSICLQIRVVRLITVKILMQKPLQSLSESPNPTS